MPSGYLVDSGSQYGNRGNGQSYGWLGSDQDRTRDRNSPNAPDQRFDTLNHLFDGSTARTWELGLANGQYTVRLQAGDPAYADQVNTFALEGITLTDPDGQDNFDTFLVNVEVTDGRLTLTDALGADNAKVQFIEVTPQALANPLPGGFITTTDVGPVTIAGDTIYADGVFTVTGSGTLNGDFNDDAFQYAYSTVNGNFFYTARLTSLDAANNGTKAGIMVRTSTDPTAPMSFIGIEPNFRDYNVFRTFKDAERQNQNRSPRATEFPLYFRVDRFDELIISYTSANGADWDLLRTNRIDGLPTNGVQVGLAVASRTSGATSTATFDSVHVAPLTPPTGLQTAYFGNSYPGGQVIMPESAYTSFTVSDTGETLIAANNERDDFVVFDADGDITAEFGDGGGYGITGNSSHWFMSLGTRVDTDPRYKFDGVVRLDRNGDNRQQILAGRQVRGLALAGNTLFVADRDANTIRRFNATTLAEIGTGWSLPNAGNMAADNNGNLWIIIEPSVPSGSWEIRHYSPTGTNLNHTITNVQHPRGLAVHPSTNQLFVTNIGEDQRIQRYSSTGTAQGRIGSTGGIFGTGAGTDAGEVHPSKFNFPTGVGFDSNGNMIVANNGSPGHWNRYSRGSGLVLTKYSGTSTNDLWNRYGLEFVDVADVDPDSNGQTIYTKDSIYSFDPSQPLGQQWTYLAHTIDPFEYPDDPRVLGTFFDPSRTDDWSRVGTAVVSRVGGKTVLYVHNMDGTGVAWYGFDGNIAKPAGWMESVIDYDGDGDDEWMFWQDADGDGQRDNGEVQFFTKDGGTHGFKITDDGQVFAASDDDGLRIFNTTIVNGIPTLSSTPINNPEAEPALFAGDGGRLRRVIYDSSSDTAILSGYTEAPPPDDARSVKDAGRVLAYYEHWNGISGTRTLVTHRTFDVTFEDFGRHESDTISDIAAVGDYVFAVRNPDTREIQVYERTTLDLVDTLVVGPEVGVRIGINDLSIGINADQLNDGTYMIILEDDLDQKGVVLYWKGPQNAYLDTVRDATDWVEAEFFDEGGNGVAYEDDASRSGNQTFRANETADIGDKSNASNGKVVGWTNAGEALEYTVDLPNGVYDFELRYASGANPGDLRILLDDGAATLELGTLTTLVNTGGWNTFQTTTLSNVTVSNGGSNRVLRLEMLGGGFDLDQFRFAPVTLSAVGKIQAEYGVQTLGSDLTVEGTAPTFVWLPQGSGSTPDPETAPRLAYNLKDITAGTYDVTFRVNVDVGGPTQRGSNNSFFLRSNGGAWQTIQFATNQAGWFEQTINLNLNLSGDALIEIAAREDGTKLDWFALA
ncbi:MAG: carbohydrate-binding protein [Planctomycetota bacterium]